MGRFAVVDHEDKELAFGTTFRLLGSDTRWHVAQHVVASRHFVRSPLLSKFLLYIVAETIAGRASEITEHQIGVNVFDRPIHYRTVEDNIVRNYARQLRRRLSDYFLQEGTSEPLQIDIPLGGYVPVFVTRDSHETNGSITERPLPSNALPEPHPVAEDPRPKRTWTRLPSVTLPKLLLLGLYTSVIFCAAWFGGREFRAAAAPETQTTPIAPLWNALFGSPLTTYIVPADAGLNLIEDISRKPLRLADYINGDYAKSPLPQVDEHSAEDLRTQDFTSFVDLQIISSLVRLPAFNAQRAILRFPRDLRVDDLKNANAVILGSVGSNPWAAIAEDKANFRIVYRDGMQGATIVNSHPQNGEAPEYVSHWDEPAHETFALISYLPNLGGSGRLLIVQGLDVAGTQAAGEALFHSEIIAPILHRATRPDGSLRYFEVLLRATSIESSATGTSVIGSRVY